MGGSRRAVFLDRDGVLNELVNGRPPPTAKELVIPQEVPSALRLLEKVGFLLITVSNQPDIARGKTSWRDVLDIHKRLLNQLPLDNIFFCPHDDADNCSCRKPKPGMLLHAAEIHGIDLSRSYMVGDTWKDIAAGRAAGCKTIQLIRYHPIKPIVGADNVTLQSLLAVAGWILLQEGE